MITEQQYRRLMKEHAMGGSVSRSAMMAGMDRKTAQRYLKAGCGPDGLRTPHTWRTRADPLAAIWPEAQRWLEHTPELEAKALFEHLLATRAGEIDSRALRTFQRRVTEWRERHGPPKEVFFPQVREPGERMQIDWTYANELRVTIVGVAFEHLLFHAVLPFSNWEFACPCVSESLLSLKSGLQAAAWTLGGVAPFTQSDHSSTATHQLRRGQAERGFNREYLALCAHLGTEPRTINKACPHENGDVESAHGHLKRRLLAHLTLRGSSDFADLASYAAFVAEVCRGANALRMSKVIEELPRLRPLPTTRFPESELMSLRVSSHATVRIKHCAYSVPARLIGTWVQAHVREDQIAIHHGGIEVARYPRSATQQPRIDYRHVVHSLVRKPGAFAGYRYREELFPRPVFRHAYDALRAVEERRADARYVQLLLLAAEAGEQPVAEAVAALLRAGDWPDPAVVEKQIRAHEPAAPQQMVAFTPELGGYDELLSVEAGA
jgi:transposase